MVASAPPVLPRAQRLHVTHVYSWDFYDGPRSGFASLAEPNVEFIFWTIDERYNPEDCDDRLFVVYAVPVGTLAAVSALGNTVDGDTLKQLQLPCPTDWPPGESAADKDARWQRDLASYGVPHYLFLAPHFPSIKQHWTFGASISAELRPSFDSLRL